MLERIKNMKDEWIIADEIWSRSLKGLSVMKIYDIRLQNNIVWLLNLFFAFCVWGFFWEHPASYFIVKLIACSGLIDFVGFILLSKLNCFSWIFLFRFQVVISLFSSKIKVQTRWFWCILKQNFEKLTSFKISFQSSDAITFFEFN